MLEDERQIQLCISELRDTFLGVQTKRDVAVPGFGLGTPRDFSMYSLLAVMYLVAKYLPEFLLSQMVNFDSSSRSLFVDWRSIFVCAMSSGMVAGRACQ